MHSFDPHPDDIFLFDKAKNIWAIDSFIYISNGIVQSTGNRAEQLIKFNANSKEIVKAVYLPGPHDDAAIPPHGAYTFTSDGQVVVTGEWYDKTQDVMRLFLGKLDPDLKIIWIKYFNDLADKNVWAYDVAETQEGEIIVSFTQDVLREPDTPYIIDLHILKTDSTGNLVSNVVLADTFQSIGSYGNLCSTGDGGFLVNGLVSDFGHFTGNQLTPHNTLVHKINSEGLIVWSRLMDYCGFLRQSGVLTALPGNKSAVSWRKDTTWFDLINVNSEFPVIYGLDNDGNTIWRYEWPDVSIRAVYRLITARNGDIIGLGIYEKTGKGRTWIFRMSPDGDIRWERHYSDSIQRPWSPNLEMFDITEMDDGRIAAAGIVYDTNAVGSLNPNIGILVVDSTGCITPECSGLLQYVTTRVIDPFGSATFSLPSITCSPNPIRNICFLSLPEGVIKNGKSHTLHLYDFQGELISEYTWPPGSDTFTLTSNFPNGMYRLLLFDGRVPVAAGKIVAIN